VNAEAAVTNATRYGERTANGAASFRCAACGEVAGQVRAVPAGAPADLGPPLGVMASGQDGLIVDQFIGTAWVAGSRAVVDAVQTLIDEDNIDPLTLRDINWELAPFYCPDCELNYCSGHWDANVIFDETFYDYTMGTCPNGHRYMIDD
jgi:hypothetical protein